MPGDLLLSGWEFPAFKHGRGKESRALGTGWAAELRQRQGVLIPCALSSVLLSRRGLGFEYVCFGKEVQEKELSSSTQLEEVRWD